MRILFYVFVFAGIGLLTGLMFRRYRPSAAASIWISTLMGVVGSLVAGVITLMVLAYGRSQVDDHGYDRVPGVEAATIPAYWISLFIAPLGALLVLSINRLFRRDNKVVRT